MSADRRTVLLAELGRLRADGLLDEQTHLRILARYDPERAATAAATAPAIAKPAPALSTPRELGPGAPLVPHAIQLVGGLFLGAALVAGLLGLPLPPALAPLAALGAAALLIVLAHLADAPPRGTPRPRLAQAGHAATLTLLVAAPFFPDAPHAAGAIAAALAAVIVGLRRGHGPVVFGAAAAAALGIYQATDVDLFHAQNAGQEWLHLALLATLAAWLVRWRHTRWARLSLGALVLPLTIGALPVLDTLGVTDPAAAALGVGAFLVTLLTIGLALDERGLVAGSSIGLTIDCLVFAFTAAGALAAVVLLAGLGTLLVWHAETLRDYFLTARVISHAARTAH